MPAAIAFAVAALVALLPRAGWLALAIALPLALAASGLGGIALLLVAAALPVVLLLPLNGAAVVAPCGRAR